MGEQLKPCPFCGSAHAHVSPDEIGSGGQWVGPVYVSCSYCGVNVQGEDEAEAIAAWNRREGEHVAELVEENKRLRDLLAAVEVRETSFDNPFRFKDVGGVNWFEARDAALLAKHKEQQP